jgi:hypothetical protein
MRLATANRAMSRRNMIRDGPQIRLCLDGIN